jgi:hypothetical protein
MANNQDLYKQAIAEAKSIRETAVANAKQALEETLTPHIKSLLAAKLQEMEEEEVEEVVTEEEEMEEMHGDKGNFEEVDEAKDEEAEEEKAEDDSEKSEDEAEEGEEEEIEVKDMEVEDLKNLIRDVIAQEMGNMDGEEEMDMDMDIDGGMEGEEQPVDMVGADDEEINLEELLAELEGLTAEEDSLYEARKAKKGKKEDKKEEEDEKSKKMKKDLDEALQTISTLRTDLSEVNLLNAKLLYLNKIFRATNLTEAQKASAISAFDKAASTKEVKLVYETLKEGFANTRKDTIKEHKGFASKAAGVAPKKEIISEVSEQVRRMQKLAGII